MTHHTPHARTGAEAEEPHSEGSPPESNTKKAFTALRAVVELKEMQMDELYISQGLSAALKAMSDAEVNPIVAEGKPRRVSRGQLDCWTRAGLELD